VQVQQDLPESNNRYYHKTCGIMTDVINTYCMINISTNACAFVYFSSRSERTFAREHLFVLSLQSSMKSRNNDHVGVLETKRCKITPAICHICLSVRYFIRL
jgi:hypothetical protein